MTEKKKHFITRFFDRIFGLGRLKSFSFELSILKGFKTIIELYEKDTQDKSG